MLVPPRGPYSGFCGLEDHNTGRKAYHGPGRRAGGRVGLAPEISDMTRLALAPEAAILRGSCEILSYSGRLTMPKMKTHKGLKKRVKLTAKGKVRYKSANSGHLMSGKTGNRCRSLRKAKTLNGAIAKVIRVKLGSA